MKAIRSKRFALMTLVLVLLMQIHGWAAAQGAYTRIVVFGTSLSDPGNAFALWGTAHKPPYDTLDPLLIPGSYPYAKGGHHFSNGATWIEQFARPLGLAGDSRAAFEGSTSEATNFAVGAARAWEDGINFHLSDEVNAFLQASKGNAPGDALYVIEMGSNDVRDALESFASGGDGTVILEKALTAIGQNIGVLYTAGARRFLIWNVPDIGLTPALLTLDKGRPGTAALASYVTAGFNSSLDLVLASLASLPGIEIAELDVYKMLHDITADPPAFGLSVVDSPCVMPSAPPFECKAADDYLFWDGIHPTKAAHAIVAQAVATLLAQK